MECQQGFVAAAHLDQTANDVDIRKKCRIRVYTPGKN